MIVDLTLENQRVAATPIEVRGAASEWDGSRLHHWACNQGAHAVRHMLAAALGLPQSHVLVTTPDVGGGFGSKSGASLEETLVAWTAIRLGRPTRWTKTRREHMVAIGHGRAQRQRTR